VEGTKGFAMRQLGAGIVELHFDDRTETCNMLPAEEKPPTDIA
jgi:hypothetical protein